MTRAPLARGEVLRLDDGLLILAGVGQDSAEVAAQRLCDAGAPALASFGTAGGLDPRLQTGQLVIPAEVIDDEGRRYTSDARWRERLVRRLSARMSCHAGALLSCRQPALLAADKGVAHRRWSAVAIDMETAAVARVAERNRVPFVAIRVVLDGAQSGIPRAAMVAVDRQGRLRPRALLGALAAHPQEVIGLARLARQFRVALRSLRAVREHSAPGLAWMGSEVDG